MMAPNPTRPLTLEEWREIAGRNRRDAGRLPQFLAALGKKVGEACGAMLGVEVEATATTPQIELPRSESTAALSFRGVDGVVVLQCSVDQKSSVALVEMACGGAIGVPVAEGDRKRAQIEERVLVRILSEIGDAVLEQTRATTGRQFATFADGALAQEDTGAGAVPSGASMRLTLSAGGSQHAVDLSIAGDLREEICRDAAACGDPVAWRRSLEEMIACAPIVLSAMIEASNIRLSEIEALRAGGVLELCASPEAGVRLVVEGVALFSCELGRSKGAYTVAIDRAMTTSNPGGSH